MSSISCGVAQPNAGCAPPTPRVVELIVLVVEFDDRARQLRAFLDGRAASRASRRDMRTQTSSGMISTSRINVRAC